MELDDLNKKNIPPIILEVGFDFDWDEKKVWELELPAVKMAVDELEWHLAIPFLNFENGEYNLMPSDVIDDPEKYRQEYNRTMKADLRYPIDIMENKGRWVILDGLHRLMKAKILGMEEVEVRKVPREMKGKIKS